MCYRERTVPAERGVPRARPIAVAEPDDYQYSGQDYRLRSCGSDYISARGHNSRSTFVVNPGRQEPRRTVLVRPEKIEIRLGVLSVEAPKERAFVSRDGIFLKLVCSLRESAPVTVRLTIDGETIEILADVRNCYEELGMAIKFLDFPEQDRQKWEDFLRRCHRQEAAP